MTAEDIRRALDDITAEVDPTLKHLKLASLISVYPQHHEPAALCARKLIAVALSGHVDVDWQEARRLAECPAYAIMPELTRLVREVAHELGKHSPYDS
jgi:hypothetical protein